MKNLFYRLCRALLTMLGFSAAASCAVEYGAPVVCEYGVPTMEFKISGKVSDSVTGDPIKGIAVTYLENDEYERPDTVWTDEDGKFLYDSYGFPAESIRLKFTDVDFSENGGYYEAAIEEISLEKVSDGTGTWDSGDYVAEEISVRLNPVEEQECMYGTPYVEFSIKGRVTDTEERPLQGIEVSMEDGMQKVLTAKDGSFNYVAGMNAFGLKEVTLTFTDVDGEENGGDFETEVLTIPVTQTDPGDGSWDNGDYSGEVDVVMDAK